MPIRFYNTLTHRHEDFAPLTPPNVYLYICGPTVYDFQHIGNFRTFLFGDVLRRFLELAGFHVHQVMNLTDVGHMTDDQLADGGGEDKMQVATRRIKEAKKDGKVPPGAVEDPDDPYQVAQFYIDAFIEDARRLGIKVVDEGPQHLPRATEHIDQMQALIARLIEAGHAYVADDGVVYYSIESFPPYGRLSGNTLDRLRSGAGGRVLDEHQAAKRHPGDFFLWKPDASHIMKWPSPWGEGYPGWHLECSVMAMELLDRDVIDIHAGGEDLIFPHHECEIAQSCGATGRDQFARFWLHPRFLLVDGEKMSKSKGTFHTARDVLEGRVTGREVDPAVLRYELLKTHYRKNSDFSQRSLEDSARAVQRLRQAHADHHADQTAPASEHTGVVADFCDALSDDLNISGALGAVFTWLNTDPPPSDETARAMQAINHVVGYTSLATGDERAAEAQSPDAWAADICQQIDTARAEKDFATADTLRQQLIDAGFEVHNAKEGTAARKKLA